MNSKTRAGTGPQAAWQQRRAFLRSLYGGAAACGLPTLLAACGGGGGGDDEPPPFTEPPAGGNPPPVGTPVDGAVRIAAIRGVEAHCRELARQQLQPLAFLDAVAAQMRTQPAYAKVGVDEATLCAWGEFADGRVHLVSNSFVPAPKPAALAKATMAAAAVELPRAATARVLQTFGPDYDCADIVAELSGWLRDAGYGVRAGEQQRAHVEALREVKGDGYFYINTHGGSYQPTLRPDSDQFMYSIQSSTLVSAEQDVQPQMREDLEQRRLTYFTARTGDILLRIPTPPGLPDWIVNDWDTRYGITAHFVDKYWQFAADSVVIINACSSARTSDARGAAGFVFACHKAGAGVYLGWDETVTPPGAYRAARYFTDRLLGANKFQPETPEQRPFPWNAVIGDMQKKLLHADPGGSAKFRALANPGNSKLQLLAPSIHHVEVDEYRDELELVGGFGGTPGVVTVDGVPATIVQWTAEKIVCALPRSGPGSAGPVQVKVRDLLSNLRQLSEWTLALDYTWVLMEAQGLTVQGQARLRLRADVGPSRQAPGETPAQALRHAVATRDSNLPLLASGALPVGACTVSWIGSATYRSIPPAGEDNTLIAYMKFDAAQHRGSLGLALGSQIADFKQTGCGVTTEFQVGFGVLNEALQFPSPVDDSVSIPLHALTLQFDSEFRIAAGSFKDQQVRLGWAEVLPRFPPLASDGV